MLRFDFIGQKAISRDRIVVPSPTSRYDFRKLMNLPEKGFPYNRFRLVDLISSDNSNHSFKAWDEQRKTFVFVKLVTNVVEQTGAFLDFKHSFETKNLQLVSAIDFFDPFRYFLVQNNNGPRLGIAEVRARQFKGWDSYVERVVKDFPQMRLDRVWSAIVKEFVPGFVPLHEFVRTNHGQNLDWLLAEVSNLISILSEQGLFVADLFSRPDGSLSGNVLVLPTEKRVVISDLGYSEEGDRACCMRRYQGLLEADFNPIMQGRQQKNIGSCHRPWLVYAD